MGLLCRSLDLLRVLNGFSATAALPSRVPGRVIWVQGCDSRSGQQKALHMLLTADSQNHDGWEQGSQRSPLKPHFVHLTFTGPTWATLALCPQLGLRAEHGCSEMIQRSRKNCLNWGLGTVYNCCPQQDPMSPCISQDCPGLTEGLSSDWLFL